MTAPVVVRVELPQDADGIRRVLCAAFPTVAESELVDDLRRNGRLTVSLVAHFGNELVGHIGFSPVTLGPQPLGLGLAPLAVTPAFQRRGIGSELVRAGLSACRATGVGGLVVLGEPELYGRFGFQPAARWGLVDEYGGGAAFQGLELTPGALPASGSLVRFAPEFARFGSHDGAGHAVSTA
jgi:putative acetyltransferase